MSEHLLQQTLSPEMAAMAEYYQQGLSPSTPAEAVAARYAGDAAGGRLSNGEMLDELAAREADRLAESSSDAAGKALPRGELEMPALGAFVAAGLVESGEVVVSLRRMGRGTTGDTGELEARLDLAVEQAGVARDYSSATATPRRDMNPALAERLGINTSKTLKLRKKLVQSR
jgi:hypothetical protein